MTNKEAFLFLANEANKNWNGHFTMMKFTTNWGVGFFTVNTRQDIDNLTKGKTLGEAVEKLKKLIKYEFDDSLKVIRASDLDAEAFNDGDYRRGYQQGYYQSLCDVEEFGQSLANKFFDEKLTPWRFTGPLSEMIHPPELNKK